MKKMILFFFAAIVLVLSGCVSSKRMARMSGGVFDEYSAPPSYQLRSARFQQKTPYADPIRRSSATKIGGLDDTLINIWPFFFRNSSYWSMLWPFVDYDKYGFAIRPFYVQDGDEYSILFPLSSWNPVSNEGWIGNFVWKNHRFGFIPFTFQDTHQEDSGWFYYTPLLIHDYDRVPLRRDKLSRKDYFTEFMLAFWSKNTDVAVSDYDWLFRYWNKDHIPGNKALAYHFGKIEKPVPKTAEELYQFQDRILKTLPQRTGYKYGFFPLFSYGKQPNGRTEFTWLLLNSIERGKGRFSWNFFGPIAKYKNRDLDSRWLHDSTEEEFFSLPLMTKIVTEKRFANTGKMAILRKLDNLGGSSFNQDLPLIKELLKELDPQLELPKTVVDHQTLDLFLQDWRKGKTFPVTESYSGGCLPFFLYDIDDNSRSYIFPALLTGYETHPHKKKFWSLPILTFVNKNDYSEFTGVFPPLVYMNSSKRDSGPYLKLIHSSTVKTPSKWNVVEENDLYAACGLFYRGKIAFHVAKPEYKGNDLEFLRFTILWLQQEQKRIQYQWENHKKELARIAAWKTKNKIEYYRKCIRQEEMKILAEEIRKREREYQAKWSLVQTTAKRIKFQISEKDIANYSAAVNAVNRLLKDYTELRWKEDIGNGIFFRKEKFYNGDYNWRLLWILANGEKVGTKESTNVMHLLYRYRRDGDRSETLFFPFISIQKDGADSKVSFFWRFFQLKEEKGKIGGYFLFIPF